MGIDADAFWFKDNQLIQVASDSSNTHIRDVIAHPEVFGITKKYIDDTYKKYNEPVGFEGKARGDIITSLMEKGWIRIRHTTGRQDYWSIQCDKMSLRDKDLKNLISYLLFDKKLIDAWTVLYINGVDDGSEEYLNPCLYGKDHGALGFLAESIKNNSLEKVVEMKSYDDFKNRLFENIYKNSI